MKQKEVLARSKNDRQLLTYVPNPTQSQKKVNTPKENNYQCMSESGIRYELTIPVQIKYRQNNSRVIRLKGESVDISSTGMLIRLPKGNEGLTEGESISLKFKIPLGYMIEGYDHRVKIKAEIVRRVEEHPDEEWNYIAIKFATPLMDYFSKRYWRFDLMLSSLFIGLIILLIIMMRYESIVYFSFEPLLYGYSLLTATYLVSRYVLGACYRPVPVNSTYTPGVSVIIPCFNEEEWIQKTIVSCLNQDYPVDKLEVIVVDDCSNDNSVQKIKKIIEKLKQECPSYNVDSRLTFVPLQENSGKREALVAGVEVAKHELVTFVDSDSFLKPVAIRHLVQPFQDPKVGGVTGRTDVENYGTNYITKMQAVRYYVAFRMIKAAESIFDCVTCLSGPISCYRKDLIDTYKDAWLNQKFLGQPATFGDDRSMTNFILRHHRTVYQDTAICTTIVPSSFKVFLKQQMRWKRSWLRESIRAGSFMWRKEPFQALSFYAGFIVPIIAPIVVLYNLVFVPLYYQTFPLVFIIGLLLMSLLMSFVYLWFRHSRIWIYGLWFCLFYEFILLWQMPIACVTFWKSTWGTRNTKEDIEDRERREERKKQQGHKRRLAKGGN